MKFYVAEEGKLGIDMQGTLTFSKNDVGINIETGDAEVPKFELSNAIIICSRGISFFSKIKRCITLYKFLNKH